MKKIFLVIIILLLFSKICEANDKKYFKLVDTADSCIVAKNWGKAEENLNKILNLYPDDSNNSLILSNLATVQRYEGKNSESLKNYTLALFITPNAVTLLKNRASLYMELDSIDKAYSDYTQIIKLDSKDEESLYYHGMLSIRLNNLAKAKSDFDNILLQNGQSALGREGLAFWNKFMGNYNEAIKLYSELIKHKSSEILFSNRAECYIAVKRLNDATDDIRAALEINPEDGFLYIIRAKLNKARFNEEDMLKDLKIAEKYGIDKKTVQQLLSN